MYEITVKLAAPLRKYAADQRDLHLSGATVGEVLEQMSVTFPALGTRVFKSPSELNNFIGVYVGRTNIRESDGLACSIRQGDVVTLVVAVAGG